MVLWYVCAMVTGNITGMIYLSNIIHHAANVHGADCIAPHQIPEYWSYPYCILLYGAKFDMVCFMFHVTNSMIRYQSPSCQSETLAKQLNINIATDLVSMDKCFNQ